MTSAEVDRRFMALALGLARRGLGRVWPNPAVGCVIVADGRVVGRGWTQPGGRPHAETEALARAGAAARGATAYVSLEPCDHYGRTPPCSLALIEAGIARVVAACTDPDPRVSGGGIARLRAAGVAVEVGVGEAEALALNEGFFRRIGDRRPMVTLKLATSLDGRIATRSGESRWITGPEARAWGHGLRARHDAIAVGSGTAQADDPELTCRLPGLESRSPVRVVFDGGLRLDPASRLVAGAGVVPTWVLTGPDHDAGKAAALAAAGAGIIPVARDAAGQIDPQAALAALAERGITRLLVEGGGRLAASLLACRLVDRLEWFRAARVIGGDGLPGVAAMGVDVLAATADFLRVAVRPCGDDLAETYRRR